MKIILLEDVKNIGKAKDIVEVNDGYAKNFLIKQKKAVLYSPRAMEILNNQLANEQAAIMLKKNDAIKIKNELESKTYEFTLHSKGHNVFGSISSKELLATINKEHKIVNKYMLIDFNPLHVGLHVVKVKLFDDVIAEIKVNVEVNHA